MSSNALTPLQKARHQLGKTVSALRGNSVDLAFPESDKQFALDCKERDRLLRQFDADIDNLIAEAQAAVVATTRIG